MNLDVLTCGVQLTGLYRDHTPTCYLEPGHHGAHEAAAPAAYSAHIRWNANTYWLQAVTA